MAVNIRRRADITVTEPFLNLIHRDIIGKEQRCAAVSEIVKANVAQTVTLQNLAEVLCYCVRADNITHRIYKYIAVISVIVTVSADPHIFFLLLFEFQKLFSKVTDQREGPKTCVHRLVPV